MRRRYGSIVTKNWGYKVAESTSTLTTDNACMCFNYSSLLLACCKKKWRFVDAIYGVLPIFGVVTRKSAANQLKAAEYFKELSLQVISTQVSDEINIARMLVLAEQQNISRFDIQLPYPLSDQQLANIQLEYRKAVTLVQEDEYLRVKFDSH